MADDLAALDDACREAHAAAERVVGGELPPTCPCYPTRLPWVHRATLARKWAERGDLARAEPDPPAALIEAIDAIDAAVAARDARDAAKRRAELDEARARAAVPRSPTE
jgi:hypothetical protein